MFEHLSVDFCTPLTALPLFFIVVNFVFSLKLCNVLRDQNRDLFISRIPTQPVARIKCLSKEL